MIISSRQVPAASLLHPEQVAAAWFRDCHHAELRQPEIGMPQLFHAIFSHHPRWLKWLLITRNRLAGLAGLDVPLAADIRSPILKAHYQVGDTIGPWPIFALTETELVAGRNNKHLDFRLSILKLNDGATSAVAVSTICTVHNTAGKVYLSIIIPFHRAGMRMLLANAGAARRM